MEYVDDDSLEYVAPALYTGSPTACAAADHLRRFWPERHRAHIREIEVTETSFHFLARGDRRALAFLGFDYWERLTMGEAP